MQQSNLDPIELSKFDYSTTDWWNKNGPLHTLHEINPTRLQYIESFINLKKQKIVDIGCGAGILTESLAKQGAQMTGVDANTFAINAAQKHCQSTQLHIDYFCQDIETFMLNTNEAFDVSVCMELLEHVPDPEQLIATCSKLTKPGGHLFFSTLNRTLKAYIFAILGAEYLFKLIPQQTHDYAKFIRPSELANYLRNNGLLFKNLTGFTYNPFTKKAHLSDDSSINYLVYCQKEG